MSLIVEEYIKSLYNILDKGNIESDQFNNALSIQTTVERLKERDNISEFDIGVLHGIATLFCADRKRVAKSFRDSCRKIAFILGNEFTNTGFMYGVAARHAVGSEKQERLKEFFK